MELNSTTLKELISYSSSITEMTIYAEDFNNYEVTTQHYPKSPCLTMMNEVKKVKKKEIMSGSLEQIFEYLFRTDTEYTFFWITFRDETAPHPKYSDRKVRVPREEPLPFTHWKMAKKEPSINFSTCDFLYIKK